MNLKKYYYILFYLILLILIPKLTLGQVSERQKAEQYLKDARDFNVKGNIKEALVNYIRAEKKYENLNGSNEYKDTLRNVHTEIGLLFESQGIYDKADDYFSNALDYTDKDDNENRIRLLNYVVESYFNRGSEFIDDALDKLKEILSLEKENESNKLDITTRYNIAHAHEELAEETLKKLSTENVKTDTTTLYHYKEALRYKEELRDFAKEEAAEAKALNNIAYTKRKIASLQFQQGKKEEALKTLNESLKDIKNAEKKHKSKNLKESKLITWVNIGVIQQNLGNYPEAIRYFYKVKAIRRKGKNNLELGRTDNLIAKAKYYQKKYTEAKDDAEKGVHFAKLAIQEGEDNNNLQLIKDGRESLETSYKILADIYEKLSSYKKLSEYKDSLYLVRERLSKDVFEKKQEQDDLEDIEGEEKNKIKDEALIEQQNKTLKERAKSDSLAKVSAEAEKEKAIAEAEARRAEARNAEQQRLLAESKRKEEEAKRKTAQALVRAREKELESARQKARADSIAKINAENAKKQAESKQAEAEADKAKAEEQAKTQRIYFILAGVVGFFLLVIGFILFFLYRNRQKNKELEAKNDEIEQQNADLEQQKEELIALNEKVNRSNKEVELVNFELSLINDEIQEKSRQIEKSKELIEAEKDKSDKLLLNILPTATAQELKETGKATPQSYEMVSVLFTDFKGFTQASAKLSPEAVIKKLEYCFLAFDEIIDKYKIEKIKTIGDAYMCAGGIPVANKTNPVDAVRAGLEMQVFMDKMKEDMISRNEPYFECRLGIHTGPLVAGVIGKKKFAYDIWGDAVNLAARMESSGEVGKVNISGFTHELVKDYFEFEYRGKIPAKHKGEVDMYFVLGEKETK